MSAAPELVMLKNLARAYGIETGYRDFRGHKQEASPEALLAVLKALGAPIEGFGDLDSARREKRQNHWRRPLEPALVAWNGEAGEADLRLPVDEASGVMQCHLKMETGEAHDWNIDLAGLRTSQRLTVEGREYVAKSLVLPRGLPSGYHYLTLVVPGRLVECMVISAPVKAFSPLKEDSKGIWGVFLPLYALHSKRSWGSGDFSDLGALTEWVSSLGGSFVATLPFLASFLDKPCDPSPYTPVSRLFWNELFIDVMKIPEMAGCAEARAMLETPEFKEELEAVRSMSLVDYRRQMALKRKVLERLAQRLSMQSGERLDGFQAFLREDRRAGDYARFQATCESRGETWPAWPQRLRDGILEDGDYGREAVHYHQYVQWIADEQVRRLAAEARTKGLGLYVDVPLGVHPQGYDTWRERDIFCSGVSAGAPPDALFGKGQDWGTPPLHPQKAREQQYRYLIAYLNHHMKYAGIMRIDHVMGVHHLFWVPKGMEATQGVYVQYPADEIYAVLSIESHKHRCLVVGENLGTVPPYVNDSIARHNVYGMYVAQYELEQNADRALHAVPGKVVAGINTHDMPTFSAFWQGFDIERRTAMGLTSRGEAKAETEARFGMKRALAKFLKHGGYLKGDPEDAANVLNACLSFLAASPAGVMQVNLEDLWLETEQQNVPGIVEGHPNWRRKARYSFESFVGMPEVMESLGNVNRLRNERASQVS